MAVAVAAEVGRARLAGIRPQSGEVLDVVLGHLVDGRVKAGIARARQLLGVSVAQAAYVLGNGSRVLAFDTVPFTMWVPTAPHAGTGRRW